MYKIVHIPNVGIIYPFLPRLRAERNTKHDRLIIIINIFYSSLKEINSVWFLWVFVHTFQSNYLLS